MRLSSHCITILGLSCLVAAAAIERRDAEFYQVRIKQHKDMSGRGGDPVDKYFRELSLRQSAIGNRPSHQSKHAN